MKKFKLFKMLAVLIVLITSINPAWAWIEISSANVYYDNSSSNWDESKNVVIAIERLENWANTDNHGCGVFAMGRIANTKLWRWAGSFGYNDINGYRFGSGATTYDWYAWWYYNGQGETTSYGLAGRDNWANVSGFYQESMGNVTKIFGAISSDRAANLSKKDISTFPGDMNYTQNVYYSVREGAGNYSAALNSGTTPAKLHMSSYKFTSGVYDAVSSVSPDDLAAGGSTYTRSFTAGHTATTSITVSEIADGYEFEGWYDAATGGNQLEDAEHLTYTYYPKAEKNVYARFRKITYSLAGANFTTSGINWNAGTVASGGTKLMTTTDGINYSVSLTGETLSGSTRAFKLIKNQAWDGPVGYSTEGLTKICYNATLGSDGDDNITLAPYLSGTITISYNSSTNVLSVSCEAPTITFTKDGGEGGDDTQKTYSTKVTSSIEKPSKTGYIFAGYWSDDLVPVQVIDADGAWMKNVTGYTDNSSPCNWSTSLNANHTFTAHWTDDGTNFFSGGASGTSTAWGTASNWTKGIVPTSTTDVIILKPVQAPSGTTTVNSVRIATSGTYTPAGGSAITANGSLTIPGSAALKVVTNVANCTISDNEPTSGTPTISSTLIIDAGGALAWNGGGSPGDARVGFHTVSGGVPGSKEAVNEYIGIPFTSLSSDAYYNAWVFQVSGETWAEVNGATLSPWTGYNIIEKKEKGQSAGGSYSLTGTLVANNATVSGGATAGTETLYANSWVAPIEISKMDFTGTATVYLFTPASFNQINNPENPLGNYSSHTKNESSGVYIPSMKSFSVVSTTVSIDYATAVYGEVSGAFSAPRRERKADYRQAIWDTQDTLFVTVKSASGWGDVLKMFIHNDFSQDYENGWDGPKMEGMWEAPKLYTLNNEGQMAVSCVPSADNSVIAFHAGTASNEYTFTFKYSGEEALVLKDTKTGVETPIEDGGTYEFTSNTSDDDLRFMIKKVSNAATGVDEIGGNASGVQKIMHNGTMYILREGRIYNAEGMIVK